MRSAPSSLALAIAIWFAAFNSGLAGSALPYGTGSPGIHRSMLKLFRQTDRFTARLDPSLLGIKYWFPSRIVQTSEGPVDMAAIFNSFVATRGWAGNLLNQGGPAVPLAELGRDRLEMATCVGLLSPIEDQEATRSQFLAAAAEAEIPTREVARQRFSDSTLSYELSVYRVAEAPAQSGKPPCLGP